MRRLTCTIVGCGQSNVRWGPEIASLAFIAGQLATDAGYAVVTGGRGGVMQEAARGAQSRGGFAIGILPSAEMHDGNAFLDIVIPSGIGYARNSITALAGDIMLALPGGQGTLQEMSFAFDYGRPVLSWDSWTIFPPEHVPLVARTDTARVLTWLRDHHQRLTAIQKIQKASQP